MLDLVYLALTIGKASLQAAVYATLLFALARLWARNAPNSWVATASSNGRVFWWYSAFAASMLLFFIANTYWGNHGLADYARIPLSHGLAMEEMNGSTAYFEPVSINDSSEIIRAVTSYQVAGDMLCAQMSSGSCFTYDLETRHYRTFSNSTIYNDIAKSSGLPTTTQFESFNQHYIRYWQGWRFWLLA